jgi:hypothetical protein
MELYSDILNETNNHSFQFERNTEMTVNRTIIEADTKDHLLGRCPTL